MIRLAVSDPKIILCLALSHICLFFTANAEALSESQAANLSFRHILQAELEEIGYINAIAQDSTGFMWFGGENGLARFDGKQLRAYRFEEGNSRSLSHNFVNALLLDSKGVFWVATEEGINIYNPETDDFSQIRQPAQDATSHAENVRALLEDSNGNLWLGTLDGLFLYSQNERSFVRYQLQGNPEQTINRAIWSIAEDQDGAIWVAGMEGISRFNNADGTYQHFFNELKLGEKIYRDVRHLYCDSQNRIWAAAYGAGIFLYDRFKGSFLPYQHNPQNHEKSRMVWDIREDREGNLWIGDGLAVTVVTAKSGKTYSYSYHSKNSGSPGNYAVNRIYEDPRGNIWLGYFPSGVDLVDQQAAVFRNYLHDPDDPNSITDGGVNTTLEDAHGNIWIGTGYGLNYFKRESNTIERISYDRNKPEGLSGETILSIAADNKQGLWLGIWSGGLNRYDFTSGKFKHYRESDSANSLLGMEPWSLLTDKQNQLWIATEKGINRYRPQTDDFEHFLPRPEQMDGDQSLYIRVLLQDSEQRMWLGTNHGLYQFYPETRTFIRFSHEADKPGSLSHNFVISLFEDSRGTLWVGTHGGGLNRFDTDARVFKAYTKVNGLANDVISSITEDHQGNIWLSSQLGLTQLDPETETIRNFNQAHGISGNLFNRNTALKTHDNKLLFGNTRGFVLFSPEALKPDVHETPVVITDMRIFNRSVSAGDENSPLTQSIETTRKIKLNAQQNMLSFEFAALNYRSPELFQYGYWLQGFDNDWMYGDGKATYTNLPSGKYSLHVIAANDGNWGPDKTILDIIIQPVWWLNYWAFAAYALGALLLAFALTKACKKGRLSAEEYSKQSLLEVDNIKEAFLQNVTHELCSPLNGMVGLSEALQQQGENFNKETREKLDAICSSGRKLSSQFQDILEYSRLSVEKAPLYLQSIGLHALTEQLLPLFAPLLRSKPIRLINALSPNMPRVHADEDRVQQIFINLITNAIKYTNEGFITISAELQKNRIMVSVEDSGIGIPEDKLASIFLPFQRIDTGFERLYGTGLGLALCKKLVELHGGEMSVKSVVRSGTDFRFDLPLNLNDDNSKSEKQENSAEKHRELIRHQLEDTSNLPASLTPSFEKSVTGNKTAMSARIADNNKYTILLVDDDKTNRMVVNSMLESFNYTVIEKESGDAALQELNSNDSINLILLDVIMAELDGYRTCEIIREKQSLEQLPVIFLSANSREKDLDAGYSAGGSDFLIKPVSKVELLAKVAVHLQLAAKTG